MGILQGSSYGLPIVIRSAGGDVVTPDIVEKGSFTIGGIVKLYGDGGDVSFDYDRGAWIVPLSEEETFGLRGMINWQARFLFVDGTVDGTIPKSEDVFSSIDKTKLSLGGEDNA